MRVRVTKDAKTYEDVYEVRLGHGETRDHRDKVVMDLVLDAVAEHVAGCWLSAHRDAVTAWVTQALEKG